VFYIGVAKIDQDVAYVAMSIHVCFKCMFQLFHLFQTYVVSVSSGCCKSRFACCIYMHGCKFMFLSVFSCFKCMFEVFHLDVAYILQWYTRVFMVFQTFVASISVVSDVCCKCFI
jgi:hypothetical protein